MTKDAYKTWAMDFTFNDGSVDSNGYKKTSHVFLVIHSEEPITKEQASKCGWENCTLAILEKLGVQFAGLTGIGIQSVSPIDKFIVFSSGWNKEEKVEKSSGEVESAFETMDVRE